MLIALQPPFPAPPPSRGKVPGNEVDFVGKLRISFLFLNIKVPLKLKIMCFFSNIF